MKFSKKLRVIAAAMMVLTFGAAAAVTGTVAWFVASNVVSVSGPTVQAEAEQGMVIANETHAANSDWGQKADASHLGQIGNPAAQAAFVPTSTSDAVTWYHANADDFDSYEKGTAAEFVYASFTGNAVAEAEVDSGVYKVDLDTNDSDDVHVYKNIYLLNKFYVQSSINSDLAAQDLRVKEITATQTAARDLNKSLRVLFKVTNNLAGGTAYTLIYAPVATADVAHDGSSNGKINGTTELTALHDASSRNITDELLDNCTLKAFTAAGTNAAEISVYVYFEGEDANCKSSNLQATLETVQINFKLENVAHVANA